MADHFAILPNNCIVNAHGCIIRFTITDRFYLEQTRTSCTIYTYTINCVVAGNVDLIDVIGIFNIKNRFAKPPAAPITACRINDAIFEIKNQRVFLRAVTAFAVNIDYLAAANIKGAAVKRHERGTVIPHDIIVGIRKNGVDEFCALITPIGSSAVDVTILHHSVVGTDEAQILNVGSTRAESHIFKSNGASTIKTIVTVILSAIISRVGNLGTDVPRGGVHTSTHKGQVFALCVSLTGIFIKGIVTFAQIKRVTALGFFDGQFEIFVMSATAAVPNLAFAQNRGRGDSIRCSYFFFAFRRIRFAATIRVAVARPLGGLIRFARPLGGLIRFARPLGGLI
ncbi:hypothetical protein, partial [uncultured Gemmiger sp.]|uniref:hypothetical protein n=1 Tax=uncultured Gemmiger sp. TaxID=1623490 RepID=UPI0025EDA5A9